jgi:hypothetical protein
MPPILPLAGYATGVDHQIMNPAGAEASAVPLRRRTRTAIFAFRTTRNFHSSPPERISFVGFGR